MAVAVAAPVLIGLAAEAGGGGGGDEDGAPLEVAGNEVPLQVDGKGTPPVAVTAGEKKKEKERKEKKKEEEEEKGEGVKWLGHYSSAQDILLIGDGDFSFSLALATAFGSGANLVPTSLDSYETLRRKYSKAESNVTELKRLGATVLHGVDTKELKSHPYLENRRFDRIVFNLPHAGFKGKEDDAHMIKELVWGFFNNALHFLRPYCEIHISHKTGGVYDRWELENLASEASLVLVGKVAFRQEDYPGYNQKRGDSARCDESFDLGTCFTFKFRIRDLRIQRKLIGDMTSSISFRGIIAAETERDQFHLFSCNEAWPRQHLTPAVNAVHMPITLEPDRVSQSQHWDVTLNFGGTVRDPYFHQQGKTRPMCRTPEPLVNALPNLGGAISPPMGKISCRSLLAPRKEPWYQHRPIAESPERDHHACLAREHQWDLHRERQLGLQRDFEMQGHEMPWESHSALLEYQRRNSEFARKKERLRRMLALYGSMP